MYLGRKDVHGTVLNWNTGSQGVSDYNRNYTIAPGPLSDLYL